MELFIKNRCVLIVVILAFFALTGCGKGSNETTNARTQPVVEAPVEPVSTLLSQITSLEDMAVIEINPMKRFTRAWINRKWRPCLVLRRN